MDTEAFLRRVIPDVGNYATMGFIGTTGGFFQHRSYEITGGMGPVANAIQYWAGQKVNVYHALASFTMAEQRTTKSNHSYTYADRKAANAHSMKVLIVDCDVVHAATKRPESAYPDRGAALAWVKAFVQATGMPRPNLVVDSGNGFHLYWVLETPMPIAQWQPLAEAMKAAILANGFIGDAGCTADAARVLRPPGTINLKSAVPMPVTVIDQLTLPDYANSTIIAALGPWIALRSTGTGGRKGPAATVSSLGPRPGGLPPPDTSINAAAGERPQHDYKFVNIAKRCLQAKLTLETHGADQSYDHWRKADLPLLVHCVDGEQHVHRISDGYAGYSQAETDRQYADAKNAVENRGVGPPLCDSYRNYRSNVCDSCPWSGKIKTPLVLGLDEACFPSHGYRQNNETSQLERLTKDGWRVLIVGVFADARCVKLEDGGCMLLLNYSLGGQSHPLAFKDKDTSTGVEMVRHFACSGISCTPKQAAELGEFFVAWINRIRQLGQLDKSIVVRPFGWNMDGPSYTGLAIAGDLYGPRGVTKLPVVDHRMASIYHPSGTLDAWRKAAALFEGASPELQMAIACSFASPLIALTSDIRGMTLNFWSAASSIGKTSAFRVGQAVWGSGSALQSMDDTANAVMKSLSGPRVLVRYWDEFRYALDKYPELIRLIYTIPQGKERARMQSDTSLRETGEWEALLVLGSNRPWVDAVASHTDGSDSGVLRLLDIPMPKIQLPFNPTAGLILKGAETNYGHAGRMYAEHVGRNVDVVCTQLAEVLKFVATDIGMLQEERYYATTIATILTGAGIAKKLGLFDFNCRAIYECFKQVVLDVRAARGSQVVVTKAGTYDIGNLVSMFINSVGEAKLKTDSIGGGRQKVRIFYQPRVLNGPLKVQIVQNPGVIRLHRPEFHDWLTRRGLASSNIIAQMKVDWPGTREVKCTLGGGTHYGAGQIFCVEIPKGDPALDDVFFVDNKIP